MPKVNICCRLNPSSKEDVEKVAKKLRQTPSRLSGGILENLTRKDMERIFNRDREITG